MGKHCCGSIFLKFDSAIDLGPLSYGGSFKITVACSSVCLSARLSFSWAFFSGMADQFFLIFGVEVDNWNF